MLTRSFFHLPTIGAKRELQLWQDGVTHWDDLENRPELREKWKFINAVLPLVATSKSRLAQNDVKYFTDALGVQQCWRAFPHFKETVAYVDIETTGLGYGQDHITTIALYDGKTINYYVYGENLSDFVRDIQRYALLVTFNGRSFDVPFMERVFGIRFPQGHIDLRNVLRGLGLKGGLKKIEMTLGLDRQALTGVDGFFAVLLWREFKKTKDRRCLETLLAYNIEDVVNLEYLIHYACNAYLAQTPFAEQFTLNIPPRPSIPVVADEDVIRRVKSRYDSMPNPWN